MFQADKKPILFNKELTGNPIIFNSRLKNMPLFKCEITIPISQQGSGTPSPDNIREFNTFSSVTIGNISDNQYKTFLSGVINGTYGFVDLGTLDWTYRISTRGDVFYSKKDSTVKLGTENCVCSGYLYNPEARGSTINAISLALNDGEVTTFTNEDNQGRFVVKDLDYTDAETFTTAVTGVYLIYELAEQTAPSYTLEQFNALCQAFGVTGVSLSFVFGQEIYSGILDVKTGILSITHELKTIDENTNINIAVATPSVFYVNDFFSIDEDNYISDSKNCNCYLRAINKGSVNAVFSDNPDLSFCCKNGANGKRLMIKDTRFTSIEDYKTWLSTNPVKIAVKLATPIEVPLGGYLIEAFKGENNIISSVGTITAKIVEVK